MEINGTVSQILPLQTGTGKNGMWKKQEIILETSGQYAKKVCISMWGDKINEAILKPGTEITAQIEIESREFNGRWYTDVRAWKVEATSQSNNTAADDFPPPPPEVFGAEGDDEMPF